MRLTFFSKGEKIRRQQIDTVDKLHAKAQKEVQEGIAVLCNDIKKWDQTLFEPYNFDLALFEKARADQEKAIRLEHLKQTLGDPEINLENCEKNAAKHYKEKL